jgi:hypothetical protein
MVLDANGSHIDDELRVALDVVGDAQVADA